MAKWSEKMMAETPEGWKEQPMGSVSNQWAGHEGCEYCNAKEGYRHQPSCVVGLRQHLSGNGMRVSACPDCKCKDGHYSFCPKKDVPADEEWVKVTVQPAYYDLFIVLQQALWQAQNGKGAERHGNGLSFTDQPALTITRAVGLGFPLGQAMKKIQECQRMDTDAAKRELLGAINYLAAAVLFLDE
jgi:hypothetical protein